MTHGARILLVDPLGNGERFSQQLAEQTREYEIIRRSDEAVRRMGTRDVDIAIVELGSGIPGHLSLLRHLRTTAPATPVVVITDRPSLESAKESIRLGAFDYVVKSAHLENLLVVISQALVCRPWLIQRRQTWLPSTNAS